MKTTIVVFISRMNYLDELFESLDNLVCDVSQVALLFIVNGEADVFLKARNWAEESKFIERLTIQVKPKRKLRQYDISGRRWKIASLHNIAKEHINSEYVFGIEDDTIVPPFALVKLGEQMVDGVGMVEGVEMGRWGVPYIGAWIVDNLDDPTEIVSLHKADGVVDVDAGGFYCFLTKAEYYKDHEFKPFDGGGLGPDVDFCLALRRKGLKILADFDVECIHKAVDHDVKFGVTVPRQVRMHKKGNQWRQGILE